VLPFPFTFYGGSFANANLISNGNLQFTSVNTAFTNNCLPDATMNNLIAPHWDDLRTDQVGNCTLYGGVGCGIFTDLQGSVGSRVFTIEWRAVYFGNTAQRANFEIKLFEADNHIEYVYGLVEQNGSSATIGVQQGTGALFAQYSCNTSSVTANLQLILAPQGCGPTATPTPAGVINGHLTWQSIPQPNARNTSPTGTLVICVGGVPNSYLITTDANANFVLNTGLPNGNYAWRLKGGRHLATSSAISGTLNIAGGFVNYDFGLQKAGDSVQTPASQLNIVNATDFNNLKGVFGQGGNFASDFDFNLVVNATDFNTLKQNFGQAGAAVNCP
jgi:hypothetical protein